MIHAQLDLVLVSSMPLIVPCSWALQSELEHVFPVKRKRVANRQAPMRRERQILAHASVLLRELEDAVHLDDRAILRDCRRRGD